MLGSILGAIILGGLIGLVIPFVILKIVDIVSRFKKTQETKTKAKEKLIHIIGDPVYVNTITTIPIDELEKVMGAEGVFEIPIVDDKVDADNIALLKTDKQDEKLSSILKSNGGVIKLEATA